MSAGELSRAMEDAALLPADDPRRLELMRRLDREPEAAGRRWSELVRANERLRLALRHADPPEGLRQRLLRIPEAGRARRWYAIRRAAAILVVAGLLVAVLSWLPRWLNRPPAAEAVASLAALAIHDHAERPVLAVVSTDESAVRAGLAASAPFAAEFPPLDDRFVLVGARVCRFGARPIIYSRWVKDGRDHSLYQVRLDDFGLRAELLPTEVTTPPTPVDPAGHRVLMWAQGPFAWVLVCDGAGDAP